MEVYRGYHLAVAAATAAAGAAALAAVAAVTSSLSGAAASAAAGVASSAAAVAERKQRSGCSVDSFFSFNCSLSFPLLSCNLSSLYVHFVPVC